ncbi:hypothetical protein FIBSPDRAFT_949730 [Athelia psychrophila]|uniref:Uncharacterized protein n=1 Tax=Athelia psychrophila TaxID=1759441 RepID=A0A166PBI4_9AGAM|nr:hypothetical protein FIBSPDRAFT_949730 [Fibularhizoctonia sp. CBS 109695]
MHKQAIHITQQPSVGHQASNHPSAAACSFAVFDNPPIPPNLDRVLHLALARLRHGVPTCTAISSTAAVDALRDAPDVLRALLRISGIAVSLNPALAMSNWISVGVLVVATGSWAAEHAPSGSRTRCPTAARLLVVDALRQGGHRERGPARDRGGGRRAQ